jgi:hypothetical protein
MSFFKFGLLATLVNDTSSHQLVPPCLDYAPVRRCFFTIHSQHRKWWQFTKGNHLVI